jgi:TonB family protein
VFKRVVVIAAVLFLVSNAGAETSKVPGQAVFSAVHRRKAAFEPLRRRLLKSKMALVSPACGVVTWPWAYRGKRGANLELKAYARAEMDSRWVRDFVTTLLQPADWDSVDRFRGRSKPCNETHEVPLFTVTFRGGGEETYALLSFEGRCAQIFEADEPLGTIWFTDRADTVFHLIRQALAGDSLAAAMNTPPAADPKSEGWNHADTVWVDSLPQVVRRVAPRYPREAIEADKDGVVYIQALVDREGSVQDAFCPKFSKWLSDAALDAVWDWQFRPARAVDGRPVAVWVMIPVKFTLH